MTVIWSRNAKYSFAEELEFIFLKWNHQEVAKFIQLVDTTIEKLTSGALQGKISTKTQIRSLVISKQTTLFFDFNSDEKKIELLLFWNNQKDPKGLYKFLKRTMMNNIS